MEKQKPFALPWYAVAGLALVLSVLAVLLFARPLDTTMAPGEEFPPDAITGPAE